MGCPPPSESSGIHAGASHFSARGAARASAIVGASRALPSRDSPDPTSGGLVVTPKKKPSVIVMKRLDTHGLRLLSQSAGEGTRRAGVRLSAEGGLTPHRRGAPIAT